MDALAGRAGVPMEVMGLMLGEFVDDYTVKVVDVFAMPQSGTGVSVEAVDPVFQTKMLDMLRQVGRCLPSTFVESSPDQLLPRSKSWCSVSGIVFCRQGMNLSSYFCSTR